MKIFNLLVFTIIILLCLNLNSCDYEFDDYIDNPYRELRLAPWSSWDEIKKRYTELVKKYHPDKLNNKNKEDAKEKFMKIQKAYEKLQKKRKLNEDELVEIEDPVWLAIQDILMTLCLISSVMGAGYLCIYVTFIVYDYCWKFIIYIVFTFSVIDRIFPHWFKTNNSQYTFSFLLTVLLYSRSHIYNYLMSFFSKKSNVNDENHKNDENDKKVKMSFLSKQSNVNDENDKKVEMSILSKKSIVNDDNDKKVKKNK